MGGIGNVLDVVDNQYIAGIKVTGTVEDALIADVRQAGSVGRTKVHALGRDMGSAKAEPMRIAAFVSG